MNLRGKAVIAGIVALNLAAWLIDIPRLASPGTETPVRWGLYLVIPLALAFYFKPQAYVRSLIVWGFALFLLISVSSAILTLGEAPGAGAYALRMSLVFFLLLLVCHSSDSARASIDAVVFVCATVALLSLVATATLSDAFFQGRLRGLTPHPNILGFCCALAIGGLLGRAGVSSVRSAFFAVIVIALFWIATLTQSMIGLITIAALFIASGFRTMAVAIEANGISKKVPSRLIWLGAAACMVPPLLTFGLSTQQLLSLSGNDLSNIERVYAWKHSARVFSQQPIFGTGVAASLNVVSEGYQRAAALLYSHSVALHHLRTTGLIGASALALALVAAMSAISRASEKSAGGGQLANMTFAVLMFSAVEAGLQGSQASWIVLYVLCGAALAGMQPPPKKGPLLRRATGAARRLSP